MIYLYSCLQVLNGQLHEHRALAAASQNHESQAREEVDGLARALIEANRRADEAEARAAAGEESRARDIRVSEEDTLASHFASMDITYPSVGYHVSDVPVGVVMSSCVVMSSPHVLSIVSSIVHFITSAGRFPTPFPCEL